jgi:hypothetical protein
VLHSERKRPRKRGRLFQDRGDQRHAGNTSWRCSLSLFQAGAQTCRLSQSPWPVQPRAGDSLTLKRVRLESEYLVSRCGNHSPQCSTSLTGKRILIPTRGSRRQRTLVDAFDESALRPRALKHALRWCLNARASTNRLVMSSEAVVRPPRAYLLAAL